MSFFGSAGHDISNAFHNAGNAVTHVGDQLGSLAGSASRNALANVLTGGLYSAGGGIGHTLHGWEQDLSGGLHNLKNQAASHGLDWNRYRDINETGMSLLGNYLLPGSSMLTSHLTSRGSQHQLDSPLGMLGQLGSGLAGAGIGSSTTGIGASPIGGWSGLGFGTGTPASYADVAPGSSVMDVGAGGVPTSYADAAPGATPIAAGGTPASMLSSLGAGVKGYLPTLAGLYGIHESMAMQQLSQQLAAQQDPYAAYRAQGAAGLQNLMNNPDSIASLPGYQSGLDAVQRSMAAQGYNGSGNMMGALQQYGQQAYQNQFNNLSALAGAGATPGAGAQTAMNGMMAGTQGVMSSLGLLGAKNNWGGS